MERIICLAAGYLFGLLQTGYMYGRMNKIDIRNYGSGNSGTTNALRVLGMKAGAVVFSEIFESVYPLCPCSDSFKDQPETAFLLVLYTGLGVILGHNYPFYLNFKGGKGIAATAGLIVALDLRLMVVTLVAFVLIVAVTRFVSLGSLVVATIFLAWMIVMGSNGSYGVSAGHLPEFLHRCGSDQRPGILAPQSEYRKTGSWK